MHHALPFQEHPILELPGSAPMSSFAPPTNYSSMQKEEWVERKSGYLEAEDWQPHFRGLVASLSVLHEKPHSDKFLAPEEGKNLARPHFPKQEHAGTPPLLDHHHGSGPALLPSYLIATL
mmetsp:Transcript_42993/g.74179  ORF Transcript_42993/g.74179 Transcript_42993/m.74179 type:complete len:120 (+) Transcript_42993:149-508(+)